MEIGCNVADADFSGLLAAMNRLHSDFGMAQTEAVRRGTILLVKSIRARTPKAKRLRKVRALPHRKPIVIDGVKKRFFVVEMYRSGETSPRPVTILATSLAEAKRDPRARIDRWGLGKKSWGWFMNALFGQSAGADPNPLAEIKPGMVFARKSEKDGESHVVLENRLGYVAKVVPPAVVAESVRAATNRMVHLLEQRIERRARHAR